MSYLKFYLIKINSILFISPFIPEALPNKTERLEEGGYGHPPVPGRDQIEPY